mmetsp:Transcript_31386/g.27731  ORF Transcript_31386/g.27731 Transcript_31386/m.27731 type:complete len:216 (+) Transcript_31386:459-1106(+)
MEISSRQSSSEDSNSNAGDNSKDNLFNGKGNKRRNNSGVDKSKVARRAFGRTFFPFRRRNQPNFPRIKAPVMSAKDYVFNALRTREFKAEKGKIPNVSFGKIYRPERVNMKDKKSKVRRINLQKEIKTKMIRRKLNISTNTKNAKKALNINIGKVKGMKAAPIAKSERRKKHVKKCPKSISPFALQLPRGDITQGYPNPHEERFNNKYRVHQNLL